MVWRQRSCDPKFLRVFILTKLSIDLQVHESNFTLPLFGTRLNLFRRTLILRCVAGSHVYIWNILGMVAHTIYIDMFNICYTSAWSWLNFVSFKVLKRFHWSNSDIINAGLEDHPQTLWPMKKQVSLGPGFSHMARDDDRALPFSSDKGSAHTCCERSLWCWSSLRFPHRG